MLPSKILVTGGLGYIGSHTSVELIQQGFDILIVDDLSNSSTEVLEGIKKITGITPEFIKLDLRDKKEVNQLFEDQPNLSGIIHFAAFKAVGESIFQPLEYYENNIGSLIYLLQAIENKGQKFSFIFSSSCTVYGQADQLPITEHAPIKKAESPYGNTKQIGEDILYDNSRSNRLLKVISLRYFNPIGGHSSIEIGELPKGKPQNLVPFITQTAAGIHDKLNVFGDDYPTLDGTCIRDYIHVVDLAKAHVVGLKRMMADEQNGNFEIFNLGTGKGNTVLEVIKTFEKISGVSLNYKIVDRRPGDIVEAFANTTKANKILGWEAENDLEVALKTAWEWEKKIRNI
ncbi:MAG: UDP-glucose 4-epimerase GalE [Flavobacteriaceae bacterium]|jgi:UDP-glucose 4-epimerase|nr:UDP-glucose 4-epimerase GalE [Flavobacteriaceae bacterium]